MADESKIMKMMEEMETYFQERDRLFQEREEVYRKRYDDLIRRESDVKEREEEYDHLKKKMKEVRLRLNLLETKLQNESLKQDVNMLSSGPENVKTEEFTVPVLPCCVEADLYADPEYRTLKEENQKLTDENIRLYDQLISEKQLTEALELEKQNLFKALLESDSDTARLFEVGDQNETAGHEDPESLTEGRQDLPDLSAGERSTE